MLLSHTEYEQMNKIISRHIVKKMEAGTIVIDWDAMNERFELNVEYLTVLWQTCS